MIAQSSEKAIHLKNTSEIEILHEANRIVAAVLRDLEKNVAAGITTYELDQIAENNTLKKSAKPAFKGYRGFPGSLCISINEEVVHGIPSKKRKLQSGDIVSMDYGVLYKGYYGDSAITVPVDSITEEKKRLILVTEESLHKGISKALPGNRIADISGAIQEFVEENGFSVVRQFVGHGIGRDLHEAPEIPNFISDELSPRLVPGMVLAIEPMVNSGGYKVKVLRDGWTVVTADKRPSAHFEHSIAITETGNIILSSREFIA